MRYFLKASWQTEYRVVTKEQYIQAERQAGFYPQCTSDNPKFWTESATGGFGGNGISGRVEYEPEDFRQEAAKLSQRYREGGDVPWN